MEDILKIYNIEMVRESNFKYIAANDRFQSKSGITKIRRIWRHLGS